MYKSGWLAGVFLVSTGASYILFHYPITTGLVIPLLADFIGGSIFYLDLSVAHIRFDNKYTYPVGVEEVLRETMFEGEEDVDRMDSITQEFVAILDEIVSEYAPYEYDEKEFTQIINNLPSRVEN